MEYVLAFLAGVVSIISPCVLPLLPIVFAASSGRYKKGFLIVLGLFISFGLFGVLFGFLGTFYYFKYVAYALLLAFGIILVSDKIKERFSIFMSRVVSSSSISTISNTSPFLFGLALGLVWSPCIGPFLGSILSYATIIGNPVKGFVLLMFYALGLAFTIALILKVGEKALREKISKRGEILSKVAGWIIIIYVILIVTGILEMIEYSLAGFYQI
ncbi:cytochrome c biogenesis protein CcdA [Archaeoglobales archaeon]|nr:MAG: cytochrome c biogenesis protein CcdA [Archaeoglobales archaeon]